MVNCGGRNVRSYFLVISPCLSIAERLWPSRITKSHCNNAKTLCVYSIRRTVRRTDVKLNVLLPGTFRELYRLMNHTKKERRIHALSNVHSAAFVNMLDILEIGKVYNTPFCKRRALCTFYVPVFFHFVLPISHVSPKLSDAFFAKAKTSSYSILKNRYAMCRLHTRNWCTC